MAQDSIQSQDMIQTIKMSAVQVALAGLLELPVNDLMERVNNELMENEALEAESRIPAADEKPECTEEGTDELEGPAEIPLAESSDIPEYGDYSTIDDVPEPIISAVERKADPLELAAADNESFYDELQSQIKDYSLSEHEKTVLDYLICSLDDDGYLHKDLLTIMDELELFNGVVTNEAELEHLLHILQQFEPRGIGARSLQECLRLQLTRPHHPSPWRDKALQVVDRCFRDFMSNRWEVIEERLKMDEETSRHVRQLLQHLNPRPGRAFGESSSAVVPTIIPDFYVRVDEDGEVHITLSNDGVPELFVSQSFQETLDKFKKKEKMTGREQDEFVYVTQKVEAAKGFISLIERRNQTLLAVMKSIVSLQRPFFDDDDETLLRPLKLQEIADHAGVKISTVSRAVNSKYVQTLHRVYPLKFFFSTQFVSKTGEQLSSREVKTVLQQIVDNEDKEHPYTDVALVQKLKEEGFPVARRTVVKYRGMLDIPVAKLRKK